MDSLAKHARYLERIGKRKKRVFSQERRVVNKEVNPYLQIDLTSIRLSNEKTLKELLSIGSRKGHRNTPLLEKLGTPQSFKDKRFYKTTMNVT